MEVIDFNERNSCHPNPRVLPQRLCRKTRVSFSGFRRNPPPAYRRLAAGGASVGCSNAFVFCINVVARIRDRVIVVKPHRDYRPLWEEQGFAVAVTDCRWAASFVNLGRFDVARSDFAVPRAPHRDFVAPTTVTTTTSL